MKTNNRLNTLLFIVFTISILSNCKAQELVINYKSETYTNINPDTTLNPTKSTSGQNSVNIFSLDLDNDENMDIQVKSEANISQGQSKIFTEIYSPSGLVIFLLGNIDSTEFLDKTGYFVRNILKKYSFNDKIDTNLTFIESGNLGYEYYLKDKGKAESKQWIDSTISYAIFKYETGTITTYGWIELKVEDYSTVTISSYSTFKQITSVNDAFVDNNLELYPNPATTKLYLSSKLDFKYQIISSAGDIIKQGFANTFIEIQEIPTGIYIWCI